MKFLVAIALITLAVAEGHHTPLHTLRGPRFKVGQLYKYDVEFNVTSGVLGLSSQVSKSAIKANVLILAKDEKLHILKIENVYTSGSLKAVDSKDSYILIQYNSKLEAKLSVPIMFTLENGEITSYTLSPSESLESKKIKKSILRSLEMYISEDAYKQLESKSELSIPVTYNVTESTDTGVHTTNYMITVSPYPEFPADDQVYNISRSDNFEEERYPSYKFHHNFRRMGSPEVCRKDGRSNTYGAGCPGGHEPHQSPIETSFTHQHHLSLTDNIMNPEIISTTEAHIAHMYDQDMEVLIQYRLRRSNIYSGSITEPSEQKIYNNLKDMESEINEKEINELCNYNSSAEAVTTAKMLLDQITRIVIRGELQDAETTIVGEKIILLKNSLAKLPVPELEDIARTCIVCKGSLKQETVEGKIKRQIWLEILPLIGTEESVTFIINYIKRIDDNLLVWEAKEILEALPQNIHRPTERNIRELRSLITELGSKLSNNHLLHSAVHLTLSRVIGRMCGNIAVIRSQPVQQSSWFDKYSPFKQPQQVSIRSSSPGPIKCPEEQVTEIIKDITEKLRNTQKQEEVAIYLETLAHIGELEILPVFAEYVYGVAENIQKYSPRYIEFTKATALYSLHSAVGRHPEEVLDIVLPMFFNETETFKVRNAAFGVIIRCQPSLEILQHVAARSWTERSEEVGSFVTSTLDTFGNSSLPYMQLTSHRIKKILPQLKRFDIGVQHAKNFLWSYFDDLREFGVENRLEYTPNNESFIPSMIYNSLSYSSDSLRDTILQTAIHSEGLTQKEVIEFIDKYILGTEFSPKPIPENIFDKADLAARVPGTLRFTLYRRLFYTNSYYYFDLENLMTHLRPLIEYLETYVKTSTNDYDGQLVKIFIPSAFHTVTIPKTLPYPVEFEMQHPTLFALKIKSLEKEPSRRKFHFHIRPSVYFTKLYTNQLKNLGDCKEVGVYHEHKVAASYPFELKYQINDPLNITTTYKFPEMQKRLVSYFSEAGTFVGKKELETLPSSVEREPIRNFPSPFLHDQKIDIVGVPPFRVELHTEDIDLFQQRLLESPTEALDIAIRRILNAGWRYNSVNVTFEEDSEVWTKDTEVTFTVQYSREHMTEDKLRKSKPQFSPRNTTEESRWDSDTATESQYAWSQESPWNRDFSEHSQGKSEMEKDGDWSKDLKPDGIGYNTERSRFTEQGRIASSMHLRLDSAPHITHALKVKLETKPVYTSIYFNVIYNHTYTNAHHMLQVDAGVSPKGEDKPHAITLDHILEFGGKPNEFDYDTQTRCDATFNTALYLHRGERKGSWKNMDVATKGAFDYESLESLFDDELLYKVDPKYLLPVTYEQCLRDVQEGQALSLDCTKAIREHSVFNKLYMSIIWEPKLSETVRKIAHRADLIIKHYFFHHMNATEKENTVQNIQIRLKHINKFTDKPLYDVNIRKPRETIDFKRIPTGGINPLSSIYGIFDLEAMEITNNAYPATCAMMERYVTTYDRKTYEFSPDRCNYVLSTHCTPQKNFAIFAKGLDTSKRTKEILIYVGKNILTLTPPTLSGRSYQIKFNGKDYTVSTALVFEKEDAEIYVFPENLTYIDHLKVVARKAGIKVHYDGINVKVQVDPRYKGELCGLCGEFDGEELREFRGLDRCLYTHPIDFANSAITNREGSCEKTHRYGKRICDGEEARAFSMRKSTEDEGYEPSIKRNIVMSRRSDYCFSIVPFPVCNNNDRAYETKEQQVAFHCLPKRDLTAKKLFAESQKRILHEVAYRTADVEETVHIAKIC